MKGFLADTSALSEFAKPNPNANVLCWFDEADPDSLFASVVTLGELRLGIERLSPGRRRTDLEAWLHVGLPGWFESNLLPATRAVFERWASITIEAQRRGRTLSMPDGLIAATALEHDLILITRNVRDFAELGLEILDLWNPPI